MSIKKILFIMSLCCIHSANLFAQENSYKVSGNLKGDQGLAIDYSEVSASDSSKVIRQRVLTDSLGQFTLSLKKGFYTLSSIRYGIVLFEKAINLTTDLDLGTISVHSATVLEGAVVTARKKLIERKIDRFVFHIESSPLLSDGNAFDAIKSAPGVYLGNDESINIMGKAGVKVMIDGRIIRLNPDELTTYLKSMGADQIKSLEVITTPSSKFEAEGNAGIINIITKKGTEKGWNANVGLTGYQGKYSRLIGSTGFNYKSKQVDLTVNYAAGDVRSFEKIEQNNNFSNPTTGESITYSSLNYQKRRERYQTFTNQLDIKLSDKTNIGMIGNLFSDDSPRPTDNQTTATNSSSFTSVNDHQLDLFNYAVDLYLNHQLDTLGKVMSLDASMSAFKVDDKQDLANSFYSNQVFEEETNLKSNFHNKTRIYAGNIDFKLPYPKFTIETGAKIAYTKTENNFLFQDLQSDQWVKNNELSNQFDYQETNTAAYFSFNRELSDQITLQIGLRGEYSRTKGLSITTGTETDYNYFELFPTAYFQYKPTEKNYSFNLSYARRISRPSFDYLNPFISYQSPLFSNVGNPLLRPSFTNSLEINTVWKDKYILTLFGNATAKYFSEFPTRVPNSDETRYTFDNIGKGYDLGVQAIIPIKINTWWEISNTFLAMHQQYDLSYETIQQRLNKMFWLLNASNIFKVSNKVSAELSGRFRSSSIQGFYQVGNFFDLSTAVNIKLLQDKATLSLSANDLLYTNRSIVQIQYPNQDLGFTRYNDTRLYKLSLRYRFGNNDLKNKLKQESGSKDEQIRAGK